MKDLETNLEQESEKEVKRPKARYYIPVVGAILGIMDAGNAFSTKEQEERWAWYQAVMTFNGFGAAVLTASYVLTGHVPEGIEQIINYF